MSINKVILIGRVGQVPNVRVVGENKVANFTLATTEKFKDKEETEWHNIVIWGRLAEVAEKYVDKGAQLYIEGRIKTEKYKGQDGSDKFAVRIYASGLQLLGKKEQSASAPAPSPAPARPQYHTTPMPGVSDHLEDGDLPF